jgi:hypothetical protein
LEDSNKSMLATHFLVEDAVLAMADGSWLMADG